MPKTIEEKRESRRIANKKYREENKEAIAKKEKKYREENREAINLKKKEWRERNPEKDHKSNTISLWRGRGVEDEDFDLLYDVYLKETNCWICCKKFNKIKKYDFKCLDHNHSTGEARYICCHYCNLHVVG